MRSRAPVVVRDFLPRMHAPFQPVLAIMHRPRACIVPAALPVLAEHLNARNDPQRLTRGVDVGATPEASTGLQRNMACARLVRPCLQCCVSLCHITAKMHLW